MITEDEIVRLYAVENLDSKQIERQTGIGQRKVLRVLERRGVPRRQSSFRLSREQVERARALREEGMLAVWIAEDVGCRAESISKRFKNPAATKEWLQVWTQIRSDPELLALHQEFAPTSRDRLRVSRNVM